MRLAHIFFIRLWGATLVTEPLHILEALKINRVKMPSRSAAPTDLGRDAELLIWNILEEPKTRDEILRTHRAAQANFSRHLLTRIRDSFEKNSAHASHMKIYSWNMLYRNRELQPRIEFIHTLTLISSVSKSAR